MFYTDKEQDYVRSAYNTYEDALFWYNLGIIAMECNHIPKLKSCYANIKICWSIINELYQEMYVECNNTHFINMVRDIKATIQYLKIELQEGLKE